MTQICIRQLDWILKICVLIEPWAEKLNLLVCSYNQRAYFIFWRKFLTSLFRLSRVKAYFFPLARTSLKIETVNTRCWYYVLCGHARGTHSKISEPRSYYETRNGLEPWKPFHGLLQPVHTHIIIYYGCVFIYTHLQGDRNDRVVFNVVFSIKIRLL